MTVHHAKAAPDKVAAGERSTLRAVAIPTEHGGWSLTLEPVLLGLLVAWLGPACRSVSRRCWRSWRGRR